MFWPKYPLKRQNAEMGSGQPLTRPARVRRDEPKPQRPPRELFFNAEETKAKPPSRHVYVPLNEPESLQQISRPVCVPLNEPESQQQIGEPLLSADEGRAKPLTRRESVPLNEPDSQQQISKSLLNADEGKAKPPTRHVSVPPKGPGPQQPKDAT